jgi:hypothetical protein
MTAQAEWRHPYLYGRTAVGLLLEHKDWIGKPACIGFWLNLSRGLQGMIDTTRLHARSGLLDLGWQDGKLHRPFGVWLKLEYTLGMN